jgi:glycosyltransferase involved in cell wall biosynthesis
MRYTHQWSVHQEQAALKTARLVIANSERTRSDLMNKLNLDPERIRTIYLGVDAQRFRPFRAEERELARVSLGWGARPVIVFVGALGDRRKGFDRLFAAWSQLCQDPAWDADLAVIGAGSEVALWRTRTEEHGLAKRIRYLGFRRDVETILSAADALVSPTRYDSYGLSVQEALCCGVPALVTLTAGVAERYPAELNDLLLPDSDVPSELASALWKWRRGMEHFRIKVAEFSSELRRHTWERMAEEMVSAMEVPS